MSDKTNRYNEIYIVLWSDIARRGLIRLNEPDSKVEQEAASFIRELRQIIERLRRITGENEMDEPPHSLTAINKLHKDELAFVVWQFWDWVNGDTCPAEICKDFPCKYRQNKKSDCEENLQNGDLDEDGYKDQVEHGFYADKWCNEDQMGCWGQYYLWCYRQGVDPITGKKEAKKQ